MREDKEQEPEVDPNLRYKRYLIDRANGASNTGTGRPPCAPCWVPKPVIWLSCLIEQNSVFEWLGSVGIFAHDNLKARQACIGIGLILNILGTGAAIYTCFAVSTEFDRIWSSDFTSGLISAKNVSTTARLNYKVKVGMKAVAYRLTRVASDGRIPEYEEGVLLFEDFCDAAELVLFDSNCDTCAIASTQIITTLFISLVMCFPSLTTDVLRLYPGYDCNCQKVFGGVTAGISVAFAFYTICLYQFRCFKSFGWGTTCYLEDGSMYDPGNSSCKTGEMEINRLFHMGPGWIALCVSGCFKAIDMLLNLAIPTPTICRDRQEQAEYERLAIAEDEDAEKEMDQPATGTNTAEGSYE
jgi:hypothetical protein